MKQWPLEKAHQVGELIAAVAVVVSLLLVAFEVKQNNEEQQQAMTQELITSYTDIVTLLARDRELRCAYIKGIKDYGSLNGEEALAVGAYLIALMRHREDLYLQYLDGAVKPSVWQGFDRATRIAMQRPGWQEWFNLRRDWFSDEFQAYIDSVMGPPMENLPYQDSGCD
jgi:hypothetical protein